MSGFRASLLKKQKGICAYCGGYFTDTDLPTMEIDHIVPRSLGGKDSKENPPKGYSKFWRKNTVHLIVIISQKVRKLLKKTTNLRAMR